MGPLASLWRPIAVAILFLLATTASAQERAAVELLPGRSVDSLHGGIRFRAVTPAEAHTVPALAGMHPISYSSIQFGRVGSTVHGALTLHNAGTVPGSWVLTTGRGLLNRFTLYRQGDAGPPQQIFDNRDHAALGQTLREYQAIAVPVQLAPGERVTYLFRLTDNISMWLPFLVKDPATFFAERRANIAMVAAVIGGSLMLLMLNALVFAITGRRSFMWLAAAEAAFAFNTLYAEGYTTIFLLWRWPLFAELFGEFSRSLFGMLMMQFGRSFLRTRTAHPRLDRFLVLLIGLGAGVMALALAHLYAGVLPILLVHQIGWLYLLATALTTMALGVLALQRGAIFLPLFVAWTVMAGYMAYMTVAISGAVPRLPVLWHWIGPVGLFECVMATITLALHLRVLQSERMEFERRARRALLEKLALSEEAARLADDRSRALADVRARERTIEESAHDTRHVLHALNSAVHFGRQAAGSPSPDLVALLEAAARHLEDIIASSVSSSNGDGRFLALTVSNLATTMSGLAEIYAPIADRGGLALSVKVRGVARALVDEALLGRMLSNLINNSLKYTQQGHVSVHCESDDGLLRIVVADSGMGMRPATRDWLNEHAGDHQPPAPEIALGTGWRAIRDIVSMQRGSYEIDSGPWGTRVTAILPNPVERQATPAEIADLARAAPQLRFVEMDDCHEGAPHTEFRPTVVVADEASAAARSASALCSQLLLVRPLCLEMLDHPYVEGLGNIPAARAISTT